MNNTQRIPARSTKPLAVLAALGLVLAACASNAATPGPTSMPPTPLPAQATWAPAEPPTPLPAQATWAPAAAADQVIWAISGDGNEARYRITEQLANRDFPSDAVGVTSALSGQIVINEDGTVVPAASKFTVDLTTLKSDSSRRDNFIQRNTLHTGDFPAAEFVPTEVVGLPTPLPASGEVIFQLVGDMTVHGATHPITWNVTAQVEGDTLTGTAATAFTFGDFGLEIPRVMSVLSVEDNIRLEYDFQMVRQAS